MKGDETPKCQVRGCARRQAIGYRLCRTHLEGIERYSERHPDAGGLTRRDFKADGDKTEDIWPFSPTRGKP